ncbi:MAG: hypothetical protein WB780_13680 [Candidatus Acidiferrales bacterium]
MSDRTPLEVELIAALERLLPALNHVIAGFTLDIPQEFTTLAEDTAAAEALVRRAKGEI